MSADESFALCLTHDVDRPYKTYQSLYYAVAERSGYHLRTLVSDKKPYWQFEEIMALEDDLGVRSAFYFLNEQNLLRSRPPREWLDPQHWVEHFGRYDVTSDEVADAIRALDAGGWEVGLHGSYHSPDDPERLAEEKRILESVVGGEIEGVRQHHLRLTAETWRHHDDIGLRYDASLGSSDATGFAHGYRPRRPFSNSEFLVFPLTAMEVALPDPGDNFRRAWRACDRLLDRAARNDAIMTVLWHPRYFNEREFPGYRRLYRKLVETALDRGAWVGPPRDLLSQSDRIAGATSDATDGWIPDLAAIGDATAGIAGAIDPTADADDTTSAASAPFDGAPVNRGSNCADAAELTSTRHSTDGGSAGDTTATDAS